MCSLEDTTIRTVITGDRQKVILVFTGTLCSDTRQDDAVFHTVVGHHKMKLPSCNPMDYRSDWLGKLVPRNKK